MATTITQTQSGNRVVVEFDGKLVGLVQTVRMADSYSLEDASGIGDIHVKEHVPTKAVHSISVTNMVLYKKLLRAVGVAPENGDAVLQGTVFDIVTYSRDTGEVLRKYISCSYDSGTSSVDAHRIIMQDGQFKALDVSGLGL